MLPGVMLHGSALLGALHDCSTEAMPKAQTVESCVFGRESRPYTRYLLELTFVLALVPSTFATTRTKTTTHAQEVSLQCFRDDRSRDLCPTLSHQRTSAYPAALMRGDDQLPAEALSKGESRAVSTASVDATYAPRTDSAVPGVRYALTKSRTTHIGNSRSHALLHPADPQT